MKLNQKLLSIFQLILLSLTTANEAFGGALGLLCLLAGTFFLFLVITFGIGIVFFKSGYAFLLLASPVLQIIAGFLSLVFSLSIVQLLAAKLEKTGVSSTDCFSSSFLPTFYLAVSLLLIGIPFFLIAFLAAQTHSSFVLYLTKGVSCFLTLPFVFVPFAIILRGEGPLAAIRYSWHLASKNYLRILFVIFFLAILSCLFSLALACCAKAFLPDTISLHFWTSLPAKLQTIRSYAIPIGAVAFILAVYIYLTVYAFWTALFLNLDYCGNKIVGTERELVFSQDGLASPLPEVADVPDVQIKQASVLTRSDEHTEKHLDEVYQAQEHLAQAMPQEEDRMPTILFDDEMARQLAENERKMQQRQEAAAQKKQEDDTDSIKMSDKPL